jgi:hypothetical protein
MSKRQAKSSGRKQFFFEKKNQKTFTNQGSLYPDRLATALRALT